MGFFDDSLLNEMREATEDLVPDWLDERDAALARVAELEREVATLRAGAAAPPAEQGAKREAERQAAYRLVIGDLYARFEAAYVGVDAARAAHEQAPVGKRRMAKSAYEEANMVFNEVAQARRFVVDVSLQAQGFTDRQRVPPLPLPPTTPTGAAGAAGGGEEERA